AILAAALGAGLVLLVGLGLFVRQVLTDEAPDTLAGQDTTPASVVLEEADLPQEGPARRERIADAPMLAVDDPRAYRQGQVSTTVTDPLGVPSPTTTGPVDVPTGFPRTPEGAVGQLAAIDVTVIR